LTSSSPSIVISAPSGAGKTTLINKLLATDNRFEFSISVTTRPIRPGESNGKSYYFTGEKEFNNMIEKGEFLEWARVHGNYYGTTKKEIDRIKTIGKIPIFDVDVQGAASLKGRLDRAVYIFIVPPSRKALETRLRNRKTDSEEQIQIRLRNAIRELAEYARYDYIVVNDDLDMALSQLRSIVTADSCKQENVSHIITGILEETSDNPAR
jgi:guanylate kinase